SEKASGLAVAGLRRDRRSAGCEARNRRWSSTASRQGVRGCVRSWPEGREWCRDQSPSPSKEAWCHLREDWVEKSMTSAQDAAAITADIGDVSDRQTRDLICDSSQGGAIVAEPGPIASMSPYPNNTTQGCQAEEGADPWRSRVDASA